jgi:hypothetical protein
MEGRMSEGQEIAVIEEKPNSLVFGTNDPQGIISRAQSVAKQVVAIVEQGKLYNMIKDKKFVRAEGWTTMVAMVGVFPSTVYSRRLEREDEIAYEAKVVLRHISGAEVGSGEAICSSKERNWGGRDEYAIKSMAQTRAVGKACRLSFSWIMALAGYETVPAEEMQPEARPIVIPKAIEVDEVNQDTGEIMNETVNRVQDVMGKPKTINVAQQKLLFVKMNQAGVTEADLKTHIKSKFGHEHSRDLTTRQLNEVLDWLQNV